MRLPCPLLKLSADQGSNHNMRQPWSEWSCHWVHHGWLWICKHPSGHWAYSLQVYQGGDDSYLCTDQPPISDSSNDPFWSHILLRGNYECHERLLLIATVTSIPFINATVSRVCVPHQYFQSTKTKLIRLPVRNKLVMIKASSISKYLFLIDLLQYH